MTTDDFCFYSQNRLIQTSQTGGQRYSDTSLFSITWKSRSQILAGIPNCSDACRHFIIRIGSSVLSEETEFQNTFIIPKNLSFNNLILHIFLLQPFRTLLSFD